MDNETGDVEAFFREVFAGEEPITDINREAKIFRQIYDYWVERGGTVSGKRRHSVRQLKEWLADERVPSLEVKLAGKTWLRREDAVLLLRVFLRYWAYEPDTNSYVTYQNVDPEFFTNQIIENLFSGDAAAMLLPRRSRRSEISEREPEKPVVRRPQSRVIVAGFNGHRLTLLPNPPPKNQDLETLFSTICREADRLLNESNLSNISPILNEAISDYISALSYSYEDLNIVALGIEGEIISKKYDATEEEIRQYSPETKGRIDGLILAHQIFMRNLTAWKDFLAEEEELAKNVSEENKEEIKDSASNIADEWEKSQNSVDKEIPRMIRFYRDMKATPGETSKTAVFALVRAIEDVIISPIQYVLNTFIETANEARARLSKSLSLIFTAGVVGSLFHLADIYPAIFGWIQKGIEFLRQIGLIIIN